jgi:hypothetical protein
VFEAFRETVLRVLRVPAAPHPPAGAPDSLRVFRAGRRYYYVRLGAWAMTQAATVAAIFFWIGMLDMLERNVPVEPRRSAVMASEARFSAPSSPPRPQRMAAVRGNRGSGNSRLPEHRPWWLMPLLRAIEVLGIMSFVAQLPLTFALVRLDYESRWYMVTDRSLRIRSGILRIQEITMSFANIQQVVVSQGPLQRLLGIADLRVESAGGGAGGEHARSQDHSGHQAVFHGVENAGEIRDFILDRLRQFRAAGLGDPDDTVALPDHLAAGPPPVLVASPTLAAAAALLSEVRALRESLEQRRSG